MALSKAKAYLVPITSFPAIMVVLWNYLMFIQYHSILHASAITEVILYGCFILIPLIGLLSDVYIGRYRAIMIGIILCFISWIVLGISYILYSCYSEFIGRIWIVPGFVINCIGVITFHANVIQYNIDQLIGASANELSTIIYWNIAALPTAWVLSDLLVLLDAVTALTADLTGIITSGVALSLILVSHSLFKHKLENVSLIKNPIKLIARVLCYARKHKYPENRSALTYWEEEAPSRLDLGKDKYGGPFTEEEVEDVKTFFRMLPLLINPISYTTSLYLWHFQGDCIKIKLSVDCIMVDYYSTYHITTLFLFFIYQFIIRGCFHKYIPSMLIRMGAGLVLALFGCICQLLVHLFPSYDSLLQLRQVLLGISCFLILPTSLEFTVAQSPEYMRGMMVSICYFSFGIGITFAFILSFLFKKWYYYIIIIIVCFLQLLIVIVFVILARRYKYRVRENEVNIVQIVDDHYQRYMEQEDEHNRHHQEIPENEIIIIED